MIGKYYEIQKAVEKQCKLILLVYKKGGGCANKG